MCLLLGRRPGAATGVTTPRTPMQRRQRLPWPLPGALDLREIHSHSGSLTPTCDGLTRPPTGPRLIMLLPSTPRNLIQGTHMYTVPQEAHQQPVTCCSVRTGPPGASLPRAAMGGVGPGSPRLLALKGASLCKAGTIYVCRAVCSSMDFDKCLHSSNYHPDQDIEPSSSPRGSRGPCQGGPRIPTKAVAAGTGFCPL